MRKTIVLIMALFFSLSTVGAVMAFPVGANPAALQAVMDGFTLGGSSSVVADTDYVPDAGDSTWAITSSGGNFNLLITSLGSGTAFGIYSGTDNVELFGASSGAGVSTLVKSTGSGVKLTYFDAAGNFLIQVDSSVTGNAFGYYLDTVGGRLYSDSALNSDSLDHMLAYQGTGDMVNFLDPPTANNSSSWASGEYLLAWEDSRYYQAGDFTDTLVMVESVTPIPEPATLFLLGIGVFGLISLKKEEEV